MDINEKREACIISVRVYANKYYCYDSFNQSIQDNLKEINPVFIDNFPKEGCKLYCYFGKVPDNIVELKYSIDGLGLYRKKQVISQFNDDRGISLDDCISEIKSLLNPFEGYCWFNTIFIEKRINPSDYNMINEEGEFCQNSAYKYLRESYSDLTYSKIFDKISFCLLAEMEPAFFDELLFSEVALTFEDELIAFPSNMTTSAEGYQYCESELIDKENILSLIKKINLPNNNWINSITALRIAMLNEKDLWKKFYFGFVCLEKITHKCYKKILSENSFEVVKSEFLHSDEIKVPFNYFIPNENDCRKIPLSMKFCLVAGFFNPENYSEDISTFRECIEIRNNMSHDDFSESESHYDKLEKLVVFYSNKILELI